MTTTRERTDETLRWLERNGSKRIRDEMLPRYGIDAPKSFGVPMAKIQQLAKRLGRDHDLALALWETGWYEARLLTAYVDDPAHVTAAQMDRWSRDWDNWGVVDTLCFSLFDRTPHAWKKIEQWSKRRDEFVKRGSYALLACVALHDKETGDEPFIRSLQLIEYGAGDDRNFVKKGVAWAFRAVAGRSPALNRHSIELAKRLADSSGVAEQSFGKSALKEFTARAARKKTTRAESPKKRQ